MIIVVKHRSFHAAGLTLSSATSLVACMSWVSSSDILSVVRLSDSSSRALSCNTDDTALTSRHQSLFLFMQALYFSFFCGWPVRCAPAGHPRAPASLPCSQHPPAGRRRLTHCPGMLGSGPAAFRSLLASDSKQTEANIMENRSE